MDCKGQKKTTPDDAYLKRLAWLFVLFCSLCALAGASRLSTAEWNLQRCLDVLRVREILSLFVFAPLVSLCFWLFYKCLGRGAAASIWVDLLCILSIWFIACGMGMHDPANCLQGAYRSELASMETLRNSLAFIDDALGHWVFWGGFVLGSWTLGIRQLLAPLDEKMNFRWLAFFTVVTLALLGVMFTNLRDEYPKTRADLLVIALAAGLPALLHPLLARKVSLLRLPLLLVIHGSYWGSVAGTLLCWQFR